MFKASMICLSILILTSCRKEIIPQSGAENNGVEKLRKLMTWSEDFELSGFATLNGGTTGGAAGDTVTATTFAQLKSYLESTTAYVVRVTGEIYNGTAGGSISMGSNKTLLGVDSSAFLNGVGLTIHGKQNIIVQNVKFTMSSITDTLGNPAVYDPSGDHGRPQIIVNGGDCIRVLGSNNSRIWIDHCEFYNINPDVQLNQDLYDGLVDFSGTALDVTLSWNYFHDHYKTTLVGSSLADSAQRTITFHHNRYENVRHRLPFQRYGQSHVFNNYYHNIKGNGIDSQDGACIKIEKNVFETVKSPVFSYTNTGYWQLNDNLATGITIRPMPTTSTCSFTPPYTYSLDAVSTVKNTVIQYAGVGKL